MYLKLISLVAEIISVLTVLFTVIYVLVILYLIHGWRQIPRFRVSQEAPSFQTKVSVLIAARNEEKNIGVTLTDIINQNFPKDLLEIIVVDDHSTDRTADVIRSFAEQGVILIQLDESEPLNSYKKKAITEAINYANGELMVATDADCRMGPDWLKSIVTMHEEKELKLISGPVVYDHEKSLFERLQTLEFLYLIGLGAAGIGNGRSSTCNGANLAYSKDVFLELGGFQGIDDLASGDDELFLHKVVSKYPKQIAFCKSREAIVHTDAKHTIGSFISQRKRWASKSTKYQNKSLVMLGVGIWIFNVLLVANIIGAIFFKGALMVAICCIFTKMVAEYFFLVPISRFAKRTNYLLYLPLLSIVHVFYLIYIGLAGNSGTYQWKGREVR